MKRTSVSEAIRRAVMQLSLGGSALVGGGGLSASSHSTGPLPADAGLDAISVTGAASCSVLSQATIGGSPCSEDFPFKDSADECGAASDGTLPMAQCQELCGQADPSKSPAMLNTCLVISHSVTGEAYGDLECSWGTCGTGRRPEGFSPCAGLGGLPPVAQHLAHTAYLEAASVKAFARLERELAFHGAPRRLQLLARAAARDEVRHARVVRRFAEQSGARVPEARAPARRVRTLEAIALENAVEGCVYETFGAAVAMFQSEQARDLRFRKAMKRVRGRNPPRGAGLGGRQLVANWLDSRLEGAARRRVRNARSQAAVALLQSCGRVSSEIIAQLGVPDASRARELASALSTNLSRFPPSSPRQRALASPG